MERKEGIMRVKLTFINVLIYLNLCILKGSAGDFDVFGSSEEYYIINSTVVGWNEANEVCSAANGSLVLVKDLQQQNINNTDLLKKYDSSYWSSVTGSFTPWIVYKGCFKYGYVHGYIIQNLNTVGNCFETCKVRNQYCDYSNQFYFALKEETCLCLCNDANWALASSNKCNVTCNNSIEDGYCGGNKHASLYKVETRNIETAGFCLAYNCQYKETFGHDCTEEYESYCVIKNHSKYYLTKQPPLMWNDYSRACKSKNMFMTAYHREWPRNPPCIGHAWTGIRKYLITNHTGLIMRSCYSIQWNLEWKYVNSSCDKKHPFICKFEEAFPSTEKGATEVTRAAITKSRIGIIVGSSIAFILCVFISLLLVYLKRRRKMGTPSIKFTNKTYEEGSHNDHEEDKKMDALYINATSKNCSQAIAESENEDVYIEKTEGEYDSLHGTRQKKSSDGDAQYDSTVGLENVYSSTIQEKNTYQDNSYESDYSTMAGTHDENVSIENVDYDTRNRYVASDGNLYSTFANIRQ